MAQHSRRIAFLVGVAGALLCFGALEAQQGTSQQRLAEFLRRARSTTTPAEHKALSFDLGTATEEAMRENDFSTAMQLATLGVESARKSGNQHATTLANANKAKVSLAVKEFRSVARQLEALQRNPQDPEANFEVGRFTCLAKDDWDAGLRMLARGSDPRYRGLARISHWWNDNETASSRVSCGGF